MKNQIAKLLDITVDGGKSYHVAGVYTSEFHVKKAVKKFIDDYNLTRDVNKGEVEYHYSDDLWVGVEENTLVLPFGPGAEYRIRQIRFNKPFLTQKG